VVWCGVVLCAAGYVPECMQAPYALLVGLYRAAFHLRPPLHSLSDEQLKAHCQPYTHSDLSEPPTSGTFYHPFDGAITKLLAERLIQKEGDGSAARYSLEVSGRQMAAVAHAFHMQYCAALHRLQITLPAPEFGPGSACVHALSGGAEWMNGVVPAVQPSAAASFGPMVCCVCLCVTCYSCVLMRCDMI
jgi:hypothetical protein